VTFFLPLQLHLELADLLVQFRLQLLPGLFLLRPATGKKLGQLLHQMVSPQLNLVGMDAELARDLGDRLVPLGRLKSHFCLEGRVVRLPHTRKYTIPPFEIWQTQNPLIPPAQFLGSSSQNAVDPVYFKTMVLQAPTRSPLPTHAPQNPCKWHTTRDAATWLIVFSRCI